MSSISYLITCWRCPKEIHSRLVSLVDSSIKPKAILACSLNASIGAKDKEREFVTGILDKSATIDCMNVIASGFFFEKMRLKEFLC